MKAHTLPVLLFSLAPVVSQAELVAHWTLDEGSGTTAGDSSANNNVGTVAGGALWSTTNLPLGFKNLTQFGVVKMPGAVEASGSITKLKHRCRHTTA